MKVSRLLPTGLTLSCLLLVPSFGQSRIVQGTRAAPESARAIQGSGGDLGDLVTAMRILRERGFTEEAHRMREIIGELRKRAGSEALEARAAELLEQDVQELAVRVAMLDLVTEGYELVGDEENSAVMRWFAGIGHGQLDGTEGIQQAAPPALSSGASRGMDQLTLIVIGGADAQRKLGNRRAAEMCGRLGRFYMERNARQGALAIAPEEILEEPAAPPEAGPRLDALRALGYGGTSPHADDLTYIEGRVPVIGLALEAYSLEGGNLDAEERETGREWLDWMYASGRARVEESDVQMLPLPGPISMDALIGHIAAAGRIYEANGRSADAKRCTDLAIYYEKRRAGKAVDNSAVARGIAPRTSPAEPTKEDALRSDLNARRRALELEMRELQAQIQALQKKLDSRHGGRR